MLPRVLRAKLHRATVTEADLEYVGSITIDRDLLDAVDIAPNEEVLVANMSNGERFTTYVFEGESGSGVMCVNGAAARLARPGDLIIVMAFGLVTDEEIAAHRPKVAFVGDRNRIDRML